MEKNEIAEGTKLIGEFMGYKYYPNNSINGIKGVMNKKGMMGFHLDTSAPFHAKYHSSWNWLMPVYLKYKRIAVPEGKKRLHQQSVEAIGLHILNGEIVEAFKMLAADIDFWYNKEQSVERSVASKAE